MFNGLKLINFLISKVIANIACFIPILVQSVGIISTQIGFLLPINFQKALQMDSSMVMGENFRK